MSSEPFDPAEVRAETMHLLDRAYAHGQLPREDVSVLVGYIAQALGELERLVPTQSGSSL